MDVPREKLSWRDAQVILPSKMKTLKNFDGDRNDSSQTNLYKLDYHEAEKRNREFNGNKPEDPNLIVGFLLESADQTIAIRARHCPNYKWIDSMRSKKGTTHPFIVDGATFFWICKDGKLIYASEAGDYSLSLSAWLSPDQNSLAIYREKNEEIDIISIPKKKRIACLEGSSVGKNRQHNTITGCCFSPHGKYFAVARTLISRVAAPTIIYDGETFQPLYALPIVSGAIDSMKPYFSFGEDKLFGGQGEKLKLFARLDTGHRWNQEKEEKSDETRYWTKVTFKLPKPQESEASE